MDKYILRWMFLVCSLSTVTSKGQLKVLDEGTWQQMLSGEWMVEFYAPWCPACRSMQTTWEEFADWSKDLGIEVGQVDVTSNPGLSGRFMVTALPTIYHIKDGVFRQYKGSRSKDDFISFIEDKKWNTIEAVSNWKSPQSIPMSFVSYFFKLSMILRSIHTQFVETYGIPNWGSYAIFAAGTIVVGAVLGLILVCTIDFLFPPKPIPSFKEETDNIEETKKETEEEIIKDKDEDDDKETEVRKRNVTSEKDEDDNSSDKS